VFPGGGVVYGMQGFRTWLWIATGLAIAMLLVAATVLRERRGQGIQEFTVDPESAVEVVAAAVGKCPPRPCRDGASARLQSFAP
jgi:hypothetical protein